MEYASLVRHIKEFEDDLVLVKTPLCKEAVMKLIAHCAEEGRPFSKWLHEVDYDVRKDRDVVLALLKTMPTFGEGGFSFAHKTDYFAAHYITAELLEEEEMLLEFARVYPLSEAVQRWLEQRSEDEEAVGRVVAANSLALRYAPHQLRAARQFVMRLLATYEEAQRPFHGMCFLDSSLLNDRGVALVGARTWRWGRRAPEVLRWGPSDAKLLEDEEVRRAMLHVNPGQLLRGDDLGDREVMVWAGFAQPEVLAGADEGLRHDAGFVLEAIAECCRRGEVFDAMWYVGRELRRNRRVALAALRSGEQSTLWVPRELLRDGEVLAACVDAEKTNRERVLLRAPNEVRDEGATMCKVVVAHPWAVKYVSSRLRESKEFALEVIAGLVKGKRIFGHVWFLSQGLLQDRDVVLAAARTFVKGLPCPLKFTSLSAELQNDPEVRQAFDELSEDPTLACSNSPFAYEPPCHGLYPFNCRPSIHDILGGIVEGELIGRLNSDYHWHPDDGKALLAMGRGRLHEPFEVMYWKQKMFHVASRIPVEEFELCELYCRFEPRAVLGRLHEVPDALLWRAAGGFGSGRNMRYLLHLARGRSNELIVRMVEQYTRGGWEVKARHVGEELLADREVALAVVKALKKGFKERSDCPIPPEVLQDPEVMAELFAAAPAEAFFWSWDKDSLRTAVMYDVRALRHASPQILKDREFILELLRLPLYDIAKAIVLHADAGVLRDKDVVLAIANSLHEVGPWVCWEVPPEILEDREMVLRVVGVNPTCLEKAPEAMRDDEEVVEAAVRYTGVALQFASARLRKSKSFVLRLLQLPSSDVGQHMCACLHEDLWDDCDVAMAVWETVKRCPPQPLRQETPSSVTLHSSSHPTSAPELCEPSTPLSSNGSDMSCWDPQPFLECPVQYPTTPKAFADFIPRGLLLSATQGNTSCLEVLLECVRLNPRLLDNAPEMLMDDEDTVRIAFDSDHRFIRFASPRLLQNRRFVLELLHKTTASADPCLVDRLGEYTDGDEEVADAKARWEILHGVVALRCEGWNVTLGMLEDAETVRPLVAEYKLFRCTSKKLRGDREFVLEALRSGWVQTLDEAKCIAPELLQDRVVARYCPAAISLKQGFARRTMGKLRKGFGKLFGKR